MEITPLQKVLQLKCPLHPSNQSDILHISAGAATHRACIKCILSGVVSPLAALDIKSLFQAADNENSLLSNYPPLGDPTFYQRLENIQQFSADDTIEQILQFIGDLKHSFDEILEKIQKDSFRKVIELAQQRRNVLDLYQSLCESNKLKDAIIQAAESKQESRLHEVILKKCQDAVINASKLLPVIGQFEADHQKFSMRLAYKSFENLLNTMRNISFFAAPNTSLIDSHSILQKFQLVSRNQHDSVSRTVISRKENNHLDAKCIQNNGTVCTLFSSNVLDNNTHYTFRFAFHQEATEGGPWFIIGLINEKDKDQKTFNGFRYKEHNQDCQINKIIKGVALNSASNAKNVHKEVEMRVHLASRTVKVADFPNYNNVVELADKRHIIEGCQYCLLVGLAWVNNHITLTEVAVSDSFDNSM